MIGDREGGPPEGSPHRNDDHRDQDEDDGFTKADEMEPGLDEQANPGGRQNSLHGIESLALQGIERRPMRLLRGEVVTANGGQRVGPPVPGGDEQQNGNEDRVRRKEKGYLAVGKSQHPGGSRRQIIASTAGQNLEYRAEREPRLPHCLHHSSHSIRSELGETAYGESGRQATGSTPSPPASMWAGSSSGDARVSEKPLYRKTAV